MFYGSVLWEIWVVNQALEVFSVLLCLPDEVTHVNFGSPFEQCSLYLRPRSLRWNRLKNAFKEILRVFGGV